MHLCISPSHLCFSLMITLCSNNFATKVVFNRRFVAVLRNKKFLKYLLHQFPCHCTMIYPIALIYLFPLSGPKQATLPHVMDFSGLPPVLKPILESVLSQLDCSLPIISILALECMGQPCELKPSLLQLSCRDASAPINDFHQYHDQAKWHDTSRQR